MKKFLRITRKILLWTTGIWLGLLLLLQIILSPAVLSKIINSVSDEYMDADLKFSKAYVSVFRHFPKITLNLENLEVTYPSDRFDSLEKKSVQGHLLYSGCAEQADTLVSIKRLSASISLRSLLAGNIRLPHIEAESPRVFAHSYDEDNANWNIFIFEDEQEQKDTARTETGVDSGEESMNIILGEVSVTGNPRIIYTDSQDTLFAAIGLHRLFLDGKFNTGAIHKTRLNAHMDSLFIAGRYGTDTLAMGIDMLEVLEKGRRMTLRAKAKTFVATEALGRLMIPIDMEGVISLPEDPGIAVSVTDFKADIAKVPLTGRAEVRMRNDKVLADGELKITGCKAQHILDNYLASYIPELSEVTTDTEVTATAYISGAYDYMTGSLPEIRANLTVPESSVDYTSFPKRITLALDADMAMDTLGRIDAGISKAILHTYGLDLKASGGAYDLTGDDPMLRIESDMKVSLDSLRAFLPDTMNILAKGRMEARLRGKTRMSDLDIYRFSSADMEGMIISDGIEIIMPDDSIDIRLKALDMRLSPETVTSRKDPSKSFKMMKLSGTLENADFNYSKFLRFTGKKLEFTARNSSDQAAGDTTATMFLSGQLNAGLLEMADSEGATIKMENTRNRIRVHPKKGQPDVPMLGISNSNLRITYIASDFRAIFTDSKIQAEAAMNTIERERRRKAFLDSLQLAYPEVPRDSLLAHNFRQRTPKATPSWMKEDDFRSSDLSVDFGETFKKYFREWDLKGGLSVRTGIVMTPYFPLRNILRGAECSITNNTIALDSIRFMAGESTITGKGTISGLRRALLRNGRIDIDLDITSDCVNADELLRAYNAGSLYQPQTEGTTGTEVSNAEFFKQVTTDTLAKAETSSSLLIVPGNIAADITVNAGGIKYKDLDISRLTANMLMKERCIQLTDTGLESNMGKILFEGFYTTRSKTDIRTGFCLDLNDITAERVIALAPEIGEIMPMIGSLSGLLDCEVAATAEMDTLMNIRMNTLNGIARLSGRDLVIEDDEVFTSVARKLMFRDKKKGQMDELMVEGVIKDNTLEIFPFILKLDRYTLGLSGIQNLDMSYKHHVSVLRSPLLFRIGLNISGPDYDNMKFKIGRAQYRIKKMPSFSAVVDQSKNDLRYSIHNIFDNGVDETLEKNDIGSMIRTHQNEIGYINPAELELEALDESEMAKYNGSEATESLMEDLTAKIVVAVLEAIEERKDNNQNHE